MAPVRKKIAQTGFMIRVDTPEQLGEKQNKASRKDKLNRR